MFYPWRAQCKWRRVQSIRRRRFEESWKNTSCWCCGHEISVFSSRPFPHKHSVAWPFTQLIVCHTGKSSPFWQLLAKSDNLQLLCFQQRSQHLCLACRVLILTVVRPTRFRTNCFKDNTRSAILNTFTRIFPRKKSSVSTRYATLPVHTPSKWYTSVKLSEILASCSPFYIHFVESRGFTWTGYGQRTKPLLTGYAK